MDYLVLIIGAGRSWEWGNKPSQKGDYEMASPCVMSDLPQRILEQVLVQEVIRLCSKVCFGTEFVAFQEKEGHVETTLKDRCTGEEYRVKSQYLISADGARRAVLSALSIPIIGKQLNTAFNVHTKADLTKYIAYRPGSLNWILNRDAPDWSAVGNFPMVRPWNELVVSLHPATKDGKSFVPTEPKILDRLHQMIDNESVKIEILSSSNGPSTIKWLRVGRNHVCFVLEIQPIGIHPSTD